MSQPPDRATQRYADMLSALLLALAVIALYARVLGFPFIAFDDVELILHNPEVTTPSRAWLELLLTPHVGYIVPVTVSIEAALYALSGGKPWSFHAAALLLHAGFVWQLFALARELGLRRSLAFAAALLFAWHPLTVQPVAWAICIKDLWMANFALGATRAFLASTRAGDGLSARRVPVGLLAVVLAALAMLSKPTASLIGVAWLAQLGARFLRDRSLPRDPALLACSVLLLGVAIGSASRFAHETLMPSNAAAEWTPNTPFAVLGRQLAHVVWPADLAIVYPTPKDQPSPALTALGVAGVLAFALLAYGARRDPRRMLLCGLALAFYLPTSNVLPFGRVLSDSYMYLPLATLVLVVAFGLEPRLAALATEKTRPRALAFLLVLVLALLAFTSSAQLERYRGGDALWAPVVRAYPRLASAHRLMGEERLFRGDRQGALAAYRRAYALAYDPQYLLQYGTLLELAGHVEEAECVMLEAAAFGTNRTGAVYNYAAMLALNQAYVSRYPAIARSLVAELHALEARGQLTFPAALEPRLGAQEARLRATPGGELRWPERNCAALR